MPRAFVLSRTGRTVTVTFDDGGMNLLGSGALHELLSTVREAAVAAERPAVLLFRSGRTGLFAAGADMAEMRAFSAFEAIEFSRLGQEVMRAVERLPMLSVAAVDGDCFGGALDLILSFDLRYATSRSRFSHPGARLGIVTGFGGTSRWRRVLPSPSARRLFLQNHVLDAAQAVAGGLVDAIGEPPPEAFAAVDPVRIRFLKELILHGSGAGRATTARTAELLGSLYGQRQASGRREPGTHDRALSRS